MTKFSPGYDTGEDSFDALRKKLIEAKDSVENYHRKLGGEKVALFDESTNDNEAQKWIALRKELVCMRSERDQALEDLKAEKEGHAQTFEMSNAYREKNDKRPAACDRTAYKPGEYYDCAFCGTHSEPGNKHPGWCPHGNLMELCVDAQAFRYRIERLDRTERGPSAVAKAKPYRYGPSVLADNDDDVP